MICRRLGETIRGRARCSFPALVLRKELQDRLERKGQELEWGDVIRVLDDLREMRVTTDGTSILVGGDDRQSLPGLRRCAAPDAAAAGELAASGEGNPWHQAVPHPAAHRCGWPV